MTADPWPLERLRGDAAAFHGRDLPDPVERRLWWFEVERPALVLGSTQGGSVVDPDALVEAGTDVVTRRSGGGAVLVAPGAVTWVDVLLPAGDAQWSDDVGRSFHWLGRVWARVLDRLGWSRAEVHEGPMVRTAWSDLVCFAGIGPGEVLVDGRKVVGIAQRRTRAGARFQCAVVHRWQPTELVRLLALSPQQRSAADAEIADVAVGIGAIESSAVVAALAAELEKLD